MYNSYDDVLSKKMGKVSFNFNIFLIYSSQSGGLWALPYKLAWQIAAKKKSTGHNYVLQVIKIEVELYLRVNGDYGIIAVCLTFP